MNTLLTAFGLEKRSHGLAERFREEGNEVLEARNGSEVLRYAGLYEPDLLILDSDLPGMNGLTICERLRASGSRVPVILLVPPGREVDGVFGLRAGADDYLTHPVRFQELAARTHAVLRRAEARRSSIDVHTIGDVRVDFRRYTATAQGRPLKLTALEYDLLRALAARRGELVTRDELQRTVWNGEASRRSRALDVHVARLRQKIEPNPREPRYLLTVHARGYRLAG